MGRYIGPVCKLCRREGAPLYLKAERCYSPKCPFLKPSRDGRGNLPSPPGAGAIRFRPRPTEFGLQLRQKQRARRIYGVMEGQFKSYFLKAERMKGVTGENLLRQLESRLDNFVFRAGLALSRRQARELVSHGHFQVDGKKVNIASYQVRPGQVVSLREPSRALALFSSIRTVASARPVPSWLQVEPDAFRVTMLNLPARQDIQEPIDEQLIVNFYSR